MTCHVTWKQYFSFFLCHKLQWWMLSSTAANWQPHTTFDMWAFGAQERDLSVRWNILIAYWKEVKKNEWNSVRNIVYVAYDRRPLHIHTFPDHKILYTRINEAFSLKASNTNSALIYMVYRQDIFIFHSFFSVRTSPAFEFSYIGCCEKRTKENNMMDRLVVLFNDCLFLAHPMD